MSLQRRQWYENLKQRNFLTEIMLFMCNGDLNCIHQMCVEAGKPRPNDDTPPTDIPSPSSPTNPLNRPTL